MEARIWTCALFVAAGGSAAAQSTLYNLRGLAPGDGFGAVARAAGDVNGDGRLDFLAACVGSNTGAGASGYVQVLSGANGLELHLFPGASNSGQYGAALATCDINGDARPDVLVGEPFAGAGGVRIHDAIDGSLLLHLQGALGGDRFGAALAALGDVDGDGYGDFAVGAPDADIGFASAGTVRVHSGFSGAPLYSVHGSGAAWRLGAALASVPDLDGDGACELLAGAPGSTSVGTTHTGWARLYSGATGAVIVTLAGAGSADAFGSAVASAGDVDGDGQADLLVGAPQPAPNRKGYARVFSGASHALLRHLDGAAVGERYGSSVAGAGDVDTDGWADLAVGAPLSSAAGSGSGALRLFSGATGSMLLELNGQAAGAQLGACVDGGFDADADGQPDLLAGVPGAALVRVLSSATLALSSESHTLSAAAQGEQVLTLSAGAAFAGLPYLVLGSASGTTRIPVFSGVTLALTPDRYLVHTRTQPGAAPLHGGVGVLDAQGKGVATFGPLSPATHGLYGGTTFHHALLVLDPAGGILLASPPVPVTLVP